MRIKYLPVLALSLICVSASSAQTGSTAPTPAQIAARRVARLTSLLTLTSAQQAAATTLFTAEETTLQTARSTLQQEETSLTAAVEANDLSTITTLAAQIGGLTTQEVSTRAQADATFYASLTADQQTKYKALLEHTGDGRGPGGGGHGDGRHGGFGPALR